MGGAEVVQEALAAHGACSSKGEEPPYALRPMAQRAWERSRQMNVDPCQRYPLQLDTEGLDALLRRERDLIGAAQPYMRALSRAAGDEPHAVLLGDAVGFVLHVAGDDESVNGPDSVRPGALLAEEVAGANGLGTPLVEGCYVDLMGPEHFMQGLNGFDCQGIPLRGVDRSIVGVLGMSVRRRDAAERVREILRCAARGVEAELARARLEQDAQQVVASGAFDERLVERLRQDMVQAQAATRLSVDLAARGLARSRDDRAMSLLQLALGAIERFRRRSDLWRKLACHDPSEPRPVALDDLIVVLLELLETEAATRGVQLCLGALEGAMALADPCALARRLFRALLAGLDAVRRGGALRVEILRQAPRREDVLIRLDPLPLEHAHAPREPLEIRLPCLA